MKLFRSKKSFWERHRFKILLVLIVALGVFAWAVLNRVDQLEMDRLERLRGQAPVSWTEPVAPQAAAPVPPTEALVNKDAPEAQAATPKAVEVTAVVTPAVNGPSPDMEPEVRNALMRWSRAWAAQDVPTYLSAYGSQFVPPEGKTRAQWESDRRQRILGKKKIQHSMNKVEVSVDGQKATTTFEQVYVADRIQMNQRKVMAWQRHEGSWQIVSEAVAP